MSQIGRNDPCPCGSLKKYKKCCEQKSYLQKKGAKVLSASTGSTVSKIASLSHQGSLFTQPAPSEEISLRNKEISTGKVDSKTPND